MKLCLINPPHSYLVHPEMQAPLGLLYVAGAARHAGHEVRVVNGVGRTLRQIVTELPDADVYGITATTLDYAVDVERLAAMIRAERPNAPIILGGPVYLAPEQVNLRLIDCLVIGEGEQAICELLALLEAGKPLPAIHHGNAVDLARIPEPARDLWPGPLGGAIFARDKRYFGRASTVIVSSRGCPHNCAFCANATISGRRVRARPVEAVVEEMERCAEDFGIREFRFSDECVTAKPSRLAGLCAAIRASEVLDGRVAWRASARAMPNDPEIWRDMAAAGCREVAIGVESADPEVLHVLKKGITHEQALGALHNAHAAGLIVRALVMVGTPGENARTLPLNLRFLLDAEFDLAAVTIFVPFPGCDIWRRPERYRCDIVERDYAKYNLYFFDSHGARRVAPYVRNWDFDYDNMTNNVEAMRWAAMGLGRLNRG